MHYKEINNEIGNIDLYLLDQILKGNFEGKKRVLDAGCGEGRNLTYFAKNDYDIYGVDNNPLAIKMLHMMHKNIPRDHFLKANLESLPWKNSFFDVVICSAVLHFADGKEAFDKMMSEMSRVLEHEGILFIRMATEVGLEKADKDEFSYLLTKEDIAELSERHSLRWIEPFKTVVVNNKRSMATLVFSKV